MDPVRSQYQKVTAQIEEKYDQIAPIEIRDEENIEYLVGVNQIPLKRIQYQECLFGPEVIATRVQSMIDNKEVNPTDYIFMAKCQSETRLREWFQSFLEESHHALAQLGYRVNLIGDLSIENRLESKLMYPIETVINGSSDSPVPNPIEDLSTTSGPTNAYIAPEESSFISPDDQPIEIKHFITFRLPSKRMIDPTTLKENIFIVPKDEIRKVSVKLPRIINLIKRAFVDSRIQLKEKYYTQVNALYCGSGYADVVSRTSVLCRRLVNKQLYIRDGGNLIVPWTEDIMSFTTPMYACVYLYGLMNIVIDLYEENKIQTYHYNYCTDAIYKFIGNFDTNKQLRIDLYEMIENVRFDIDLGTLLSDSFTVDWIAIWWNYTVGEETSYVMSMIYFWCVNLLIRMSDCIGSNTSEQPTGIAPYEIDAFKLYQGRDTISKKELLTELDKVINRPRIVGEGARCSYSYYFPGSERWQMPNNIGIQTKSQRYILAAFTALLLEKEYDINTIWRLYIRSD